MTFHMFEDDECILDEAELEALAEYLDGRMSDREELEFESRLASDRGLRARLRPILRMCYKEELLPIEVELGLRLAQLRLIPRPRIERPRRRPGRRRRLDRQRGSAA